MNIINLRLDDRLVHGVVATTWIPQFHIERAMVIDEKSANDQLLKSVLRMATPKDVRLSVLTPEKAIENLRSERYGTERMMIIIKSLDVLLQIAHADLGITSCTLGNYGNIRREHGIAITKFITLDKASKTKIDELRQLGIQLTAQLIPDDVALDFYKEMEEKLAGKEL